MSTQKNIMIKLTSKDVERLDKLSGELSRKKITIPSGPAHRSYNPSEIQGVVSMNSIKQCIIYVKSLISKFSESTNPYEQDDKAGEETFSHYQNILDFLYLAEAYRIHKRNIEREASKLDAIIKKEMEKIKEEEDANKSVGQRKKDLAKLIKERESLEI